MNNEHVDKIVRNYQSFINNAWPCVEIIKKLDDPNLEYLDEDWFQSNWEIMVEGVLCEPGSEFLEIYGSGADCNGDSSRVFLPKANPTHRIYCRGLTGNKILDVISKKEVNISDYTWDQFVSWDGNWHGQCPPFDFVLLENRNKNNLGTNEKQLDDQIAIHSREIIFEVEKI